MVDRKVPVTITYRTTGIEPPLFVAGTFSDPQWTPHEMECTPGSDGENFFTQKLEVDPGSKLQYKFRVGYGDWWMLNEEAPTVADDAGNRNNLLEAPSLQDIDLSGKEETTKDNASNENNLLETPPDTGADEGDETTEDDAGIENNLLETSPPQDTDLSEQVETTEDDTGIENNLLETPTPQDTDLDEHVEVTENDTQPPPQDTDLGEQVETTQDDAQPPPQDTNLGEQVEATDDGVGIENNLLETSPLQYTDLGEQVETTEDDAQPPPQDTNLGEQVEATNDGVGIENNLLETSPLQDTDLGEQVEATDDDTQHDANDQDQKVQPLPRVEALKQSEKADRSGTSTPEYARTAAEVADSAALVDPATPEPEVSNEVAAEVGYRQMTSTPPQEAADTAADVADTAEALDTDEAGASIEFAPTAYKIMADAKEGVKDESLDIVGYSNDPDPVPLFAHECAGLYEDDEIPGAAEVEGESENLDAGLHGNAEDDFGDPTLERFPSTRDEIMTTVRKVGSGLNPDQTAFEGAPPSPVVRSRNPSIADVLGETQSSEESPKSTRGPRRLSAPRPSSRGSISDRSLSVVSLGSIAEGAEGDEANHHAIEEENADNALVEDGKADNIAPVAEQAEQAETAEEAISAAKEAEGEMALNPTKPALRPVVTVPSPSVQASNSLLSPVSDEDEAIVIKNSKDKDKSSETGQSGYLTPERAMTPKPEEPSSPREPAPNSATPVAEEDVAEENVDTVDSTAKAEPAVPTPPSPSIVISKAPDTQPVEELPQAAWSSSEDGPKDIEVTSSNSGITGTESRTDTAATSSGVEDSQAGSLRKRPAQQNNPIDRAGTPGSITDTGREAAKSGNWFTAFFRLIFVDWVGGFVSRLCGGKRKT
ncbi:Midasin [Cytospora mali]|uniref:Midasin n=1 Tax=Cytospora mali TaxID=578113 RepID=A0A194VLP9_CYTMA|nr:Midasin [Valsa mali]